MTDIEKMQFAIQILNSAGDGSDTDKETVKLANEVIQQLLKKES